MFLSFYSFHVYLFWSSSSSLSESSHPIRITELRAIKSTWVNAMKRKKPFFTLECQEWLNYILDPFSLENRLSMNCRIDLTMACVCLSFNCFLETTQVMIDCKSRRLAVVFLVDSHNSLDHHQIFQTLLIWGWEVGKHEGFESVVVTLMSKYNL